MSKHKSIRIGVTGTPSYSNKTSIKDLLFAIKSGGYGDAAIIGTGDFLGAPPLIKKFALDMGLDYQEINPFHTPHNLYSTLPPSLYGKRFSESGVSRALKAFAASVDKCIIFSSKEELDSKWISKITTYLSESGKLFRIVS